MKSVVVEASTVAKAIETAWLKAEKPEEFFIRILQEHQSGFLGFGSQKAKIVLFFKHTQKSDSSFPTVLKQKEYANLFSNPQLKVPMEMNIVDTDLNKNIQVHYPKNKQVKQNHHSQAHGSDAQKNHNQVKVTQEKLQTSSHAGQKQNQQPAKNNQKLKQENTQDNKIKQVKPQVKISSDEPTQKNTSHKPVDKKNQEAKQHVSVKKIEHGQQKSDTQASSSMASSLPLKQKPQQFKVKEKKDELLDFSKMRLELEVLETQANLASQVSVEDRKEDIVKDIARALKKVQSQKMVSHLSRNAEEKLRPGQIKKVEEKVVDQAGVAPRVVQKFKRRPLSTDFVQNIDTQVKQPESEVSAMSSTDDLNKDRIK